MVFLGFMSSRLETESAGFPYSWHPLLSNKYAQPVSSEKFLVIAEQTRLLACWFPCQFRIITVVKVRLRIGSWRKRDPHAQPMGTLRLSFYVCFSDGFCFSRFWDTACTSPTEQRTVVSRIRREQLALLSYRPWWPVLMVALCPVCPSLSPDISSFCLARWLIKYPCCMAGHVPIQSDHTNLKAFTMVYGGSMIYDCSTWLRNWFGKPMDQLVRVSIFPYCINSDRAGSGVQHGTSTLHLFRSCRHCAIKKVMI